MIFRGNSKQLKLCFDTLISIFGQDAKITYVEKCIIATRVGDWYGSNECTYFSNYFIRII